MFPGNQQANIVILPARNGNDFEEFCQKNKQACPLLGVSRGTWRIPESLVHDNGDIRTDMPRYRVFRDGALAAEVPSVEDLWVAEEDFWAFYLGCSFGFERALQEAGFSIRNIEEGRNVSMYVTSRPTTRVGVFGPPLVVSMRPFPRAAVDRVREITAAFPESHGAPIYAGDDYRAELGISDLSRPDFGEAVDLREDEVPVFWACGVTSSLAVQQAKLPLSIAHSPGFMLILDS